MIVVPPAVEANKSELHQPLNLLRRGVNHPNHGLASGKLPVHQEQVREDFHVIEDKVSLVVIGGGGIVGRLERHLVHELDAVVGLVGAVGREGQDGVAHVGHVINHAALIRIRQNLVDKVDAGLSSRMNLLVEISFDLHPKPFLALNHFGVYHAAFSFQR